MPHRQTKARPENPRVPWFRSLIGKGTNKVQSYSHLAICGRCARLCNNWDTRNDSGIVLCHWCWNDVEPCRVCGTFVKYGSLDYTKICTNCRNTGRWLKAEDESGKIRVNQYHR